MNIIFSYNLLGVINLFLSIITEIIKGIIIGMGSYGTKTFPDPLSKDEENNQIKLFHKVTGTDKGIYTPSFDFIELANAFIEYNKPTLRLNQVEYIRKVFSKYNVKHNLS